MRGLLSQSIHRFLISAYTRNDYSSGQNSFFFYEAISQWIIEFEGEIEVFNKREDNKGCKLIQYILENPVSSYSDDLSFCSYEKLDNVLSRTINMIGADENEIGIYDDSLSLSVSINQDVVDYREKNKFHEELEELKEKLLNEETPIERKEEIEEILRMYNEKFHPNNGTSVRKKRFTNRVRRIDEKVTKNMKLRVDTTIKRFKDSLQPTSIFLAHINNSLKKIPNGYVYLYTGTNWLFSSENK